MLRKFVFRPRFSLRSLLVLMLGIAIGYSLNLQTVRLLIGRVLTRPPGVYVIEPPDVLEIRIKPDSSRATPSISEKYLVGPDGRVNMQAFGQIYVAGKTIDEARRAIEQAIEQARGEDIETHQVFVDVVAYNSKQYYIVLLGSGIIGDSVLQVPITGNDTVLDAIAQVGGLPAAATTEIKIARPAPNGIGRETILPVDWEQLKTGASTTQNHQLMPGDRVFISRNASASAAN